jgi:hypothetical protein
MPAPIKFPHGIYSHPIRSTSVLTKITVGIILNTMLKEPRQVIQRQTCPSGILPNILLKMTLKDQFSFEKNLFESMILREKFQKFSIFASIHTYISLNQGQGSIFTLRECAQSIFRMIISYIDCFGKKKFRPKMTYLHLLPPLKGPVQ